MRRSLPLATSLACTALILASIGAEAQIAFVDVGSASGVSQQVGRTIGVNWSDINGDGWPDIWQGAHNWPDYVFINNQNGTFTPRPLWQITSAIDWYGDYHGGQWADFDNDGDQDLLFVGQAGPDKNHLFVNAGQGTWFEDKATALGVDNPGDWARAPLWYDWNNDGLLDLIRVSNAGTGVALYEQTPAGPFIDRTAYSGIRSSYSQHAQLADLNNDGKLDLVIQSNNFPYRVYDSGTQPLRDITGVIGLAKTGPAARDAAFGDFDNDLRTDVFVTNAYQAWDDSGIYINDAMIYEGNSIRLNLKIANTEIATVERGATFAGGGDVTFVLERQDDKLAALYKIFIGANGIHPTSNPFTLSPSDPNAQGIYPHVPGVDNGIYLGFDPSAGRWQLTYVHKGNVWGSTEEVSEVRARLYGTQDFNNLSTIGFTAYAATLRNKFFANTGAGFADRTNAAGLNFLNSCDSVVAADFDNDMYLDLYLVCGRIVANLPNRLFRNLGNGTFQEVPNAGGAAGSTIGIGDSAAVADYDGDGFLDLIVTNGDYPNLFSNEGFNELFRNVGNGNRWLMLDLEGVQSNRDGIGAQVIARSGGVPQLRQQDGGMHRFAQNHARIHFGLASNTMVDSLEIRWPSGIVQTLADIPSNQVLHVYEPVSPDFAGQPSYASGIDEGVYLWRDPGNAYRVRVSRPNLGGQYKIKVLSSEPLLQATGINLIRGEAYTPHPFGFSLETTSTTSEAGVNFTLPAGARALIAVERNGVANPRQLKVGAQGRPLTPAGWIVPAATLGSRSAFATGQYGLSVGKGANGAIEARWRGTASRHRAEVTLLTDGAATRIAKPDAEATDTLTPYVNGVKVASAVSGFNEDGVDIVGGLLPDIGIAFTLDTLLPAPRRVWLGGVNPPQPNAYWLQ